MFKLPNQHRITRGVMGSRVTDHTGGAFAYKIKGITYFAIATTGHGWEHVSITRKDKKMPDWRDMCRAKDLFWDDEDAVMQLHPPLSEYVNNHEACLHLWRPKNVELPLPPAIMVGYKGLTPEQIKIMPPSMKLELMGDASRSLENAES